MTVRQLKSTPLPKNCPRCGDVVKWQRGQTAIKPDANGAAAGAEAGAANGAEPTLYQFHLSCSKAESMSTQGLHGSCTWGFSAPGYFDKQSNPCILNKGARWSPYDDALLALWPLTDKAKAQPEIALLLRPRDVAALHKLLLALEKVPKSQLREIVGAEAFIALVGLLPITRAAVRPAGAPPRLTFRFKKPHQG